MLALWKLVIAGPNRLLALPCRRPVCLHRVRRDPTHSATIPLPPASPSFAKHFPPSCPPLQSAIKRFCSAPIKFAIVLCYSCYCSDGNIARLREGSEHHGEQREHPFCRSKRGRGVCDSGAASGGRIFVGFGAWRGRRNESPVHAITRD